MLLDQALGSTSPAVNMARAVHEVQSAARRRFPQDLSYREDVLLLREVRRSDLAFGYIYAIWLLMRWFGLRPDEVQYLTWDDVRSDRVLIQPKPIPAHETPETLPGGWWTPKDHELRAIDPPHAALVIAALRRRYPERGRFVVGGKRVVYEVRKPIGKLLVRIGSKRTPYDLRHTFATDMLTRLSGTPGDALVRVQRWMGHADPATTTIYLHSIPRYTKRDILSHL
jgi:integrase